MKEPRWSAKGTIGEAVAKYLAVVRELEKSSPRDLRLLTTLNSLANAYSESGQVMEAEHEYRHALQVAGEVRGQESADYASLLSSLAALYLEEGSVVKGEKVLREVDPPWSPTVYQHRPAGTAMGSGQINRLVVDWTD